MAPVQCGRLIRPKAMLVLVLSLVSFAVGCHRAADQPDPRVTAELERLTNQVESLQVKIDQLSDQVSRQEPATPKKIGAAERLKKSVTLSFPRNSLEMAMQLLADEIGVPIVILGPDLQVEGITKNQSFGLDERNQPAEEILLKILRQANPDSKLVYVIKDVPSKGELIWVTTRVAAARRGDKLPEALRRWAPPRRVVWTGEATLFQWSSMISRQSLEAEVKDQVLALALLAQQRAGFEMNGAMKGRQRLTLLSVLFQIVGNYGPEVAWRTQALPFRDACAHCAAGCKLVKDRVGDPDAAFEELQKLNVRLLRLVTEGVGEVSPTGAANAWHTYIDRTVLMSCQQEIILHSRLGPSLVDARQLAEHAADALQQAEILAVISFVIQDKGFESADDPQYQVLARSYQTACLELIKALDPAPPQRVELNPVNAAYKRLTKSCDTCHADFR